MLSHLYIENYALIRSLDITFEGGFTVVTGETGAGKSIMLGAIGLVLGSKADVKVLLDTEKKCVVEAQFILDNEHIKEKLQQYDVDILPTSLPISLPISQMSPRGGQGYGGGQGYVLILRREILPGGRSRCFVNDTPVSLSILKDVSLGIVDIHSQHETLTIGDTSFQIDLLDSFAAGGGAVAGGVAGSGSAAVVAGGVAGSDGATVAGGGSAAAVAGSVAAEGGSAAADDTNILSRYQTRYKEYLKIKNELRQLSELDNKLKEEHDYMKFLFEEFSSLNLKDGEQEELEEELKELENATAIEETLQQAGDLLSDSENSVIHQISLLIQILKKSSSFHSGISQILSRIESSSIELKDIASEISRMNVVSQNPVRIEEVKGRLDEIYRLESKHRVNSIGELIALGIVWQEQLEKTQNVDERLNSLQSQLEQIEKELNEDGEKLHNVRQNSSDKLGKSILEALSSLGMERAQLKINVEKQQNFLKNGMDVVQFLFNANLGGTLQPLDKVASGGEMSRLMLAIKSVINQTSVIPTIIFDEIDTGVSGNIAGKVALMMKSMSSYMQIIAVTHLHQIAARANNHFKVTKKEEENRTLSVIKQLNNEEHLREIAAMMSSEKITAAALATAEELIRE